VITLVKCDFCDEWFYTTRGKNIHIGRTHKQEKPVYVPDFVRIGVMSRKLTRKESREVTQEVMALGIDDADLRFKLAVIKSIEKVQNNG